MKFFIKNFGCRTNTSEAEEWVERLSESGYKFTPSILEADVLIVNSCVITKTAENEVRRLINKIKREKPSAHVIITGCLTDSLRLNSEFHIIENDRKKEIPQRIIERFGKAGDYKDERLRVRGNLKIQEGCNFRCSFCIVPFVRGKARSVPEEEILERAKELANKGFKELVIAGTHLNSWGIDLNPRRDLIYLLKKIEKIEGLKRIRLSSLDPRFLTDSFLKSITELSKIAHHFHLSFQSFSEIVLEGMNRKYSVKRYIEILNFLREKFPEACLGADIVIGFPYEDYTEFEKTYNLVKNSPLNYIHVFPFSPRKGTKAFLMKDINFEEKKRRAKLMRELSLAKRKEFHSRFLGKKLDGIVIKRYGDYAEVLTENYIKLITSSDELREGDEVFLVVDESSISFYTQSGSIQDLYF